MTVATMSAVMPTSNGQSNQGLLSDEEIQRLLVEAETRLSGHSSSEVVDRQVAQDAQVEKSSRYMQLNLF